jgi:hypothetical protein
VSVITEGQGLNITVQSYLDTLDFGLVACPELVPDLEVMLEAILGEIDTLAALAAPAPRKKAARVKKARKPARGARTAQRPATG